MEYLINDSLKYNSSDGTLFCPDNNIDTITLNRVTNDLLLLLIQNTGVPVSRNNLLNELWEKKGLNASGNNLNHYVSLLRKALAHCGCSDVITTIPKHGFIFNAAVVNLGCSPPSTPVSSTPEKIRLHPIPKIRETEPKRMGFYSTRKFRMSALAVVLFGMILSPLIAEKFRLNSVRSDVLHLQQCRFYLIYDMTRRLDKEWVVKRINVIFVDRKISCSLQANVYYSADKKRNAAGEPALHDLLSYCAYKSKVPCENYIYTRSEGVYENKN